MATGVGDIFLDLKLNKQPFETGLNEAKAMGGVAGRKIGLAIAGAVAGAVSAVGFSALISSTAKLGDAIDKTSQKMGMSAQTYQEWDFIMQRCGTSMESMTMAMKTLASSAVTSKDALSELGISQEEVASLSQEQLFARTIQALQNVEDTTRRTYLAGQLLGRGATELGAVLNMSASETDALRTRVWELGGVMSQQAVTASAQYTDAMLDLKMAFRGVSDTVAVTVLPIITNAVNKVIIPIILRAVAVIRYFGNIISSAFGGLGNKLKSTFGISAQKQTAKFSDGIGSVGKSIGGAGKSAKKAKKAVKELNRELMGFDRINKLSKKTSGGGGSGGRSGGGGGGVGGVGGIGAEPMGLDSTNKKLGIFGKLGEKLRPIWRALGDVFKAVIRLFKALGKALAPVGKWIWEHLIKPFGKLVGMAIVAVLEGIAGAIELLAIFIEKHPKLSATLISIATGLFLLIKAGGVLGVVSKIGKAFRVLGGIIMAHPIALLITAIALAIGYIYKNWDKIKKTKFGKLLIRVGKALRNVGGALKKYFIQRWKATVDAVKTAWDVLKKIGKFFTDTFKGAVEAVAHPIESMKNAWDAIQGKALEIKGDLSSGFKTAIDTVSGMAKDITVSIKAKVATKWEDLKAKWGGITKNIKDKTASMKAKIASKWADFKTKWNNLRANFKGKVADMKAKIASKWSDFKTKWHNLLKNFKGKTAEIKLKFIDKMKSGYNAIAEKIQAVRKKYPATKIILPNIHPLAEGGWIDKNTPRLAMVGDNRHEGEIVSPESKLEAMARKVASEASGAGNAQVIALLTQILGAVNGIDPNVYLDGEQIKNNTVRRINQHTRATGRLEIVL